MSRPYRLIHGISYPHLYQGEQPIKLSANSTEDREEFYNDPAVRLTNGDCEYFKGKPICLEHDESDIVGVISNAYKDSDNHMRMDARIYIDSERGKQIFAAIESGDLRGLSVGYGIPVNDNNETMGNKHCKEISLCRVPFFQGAEVRVTASNGNQHNKGINNFENIERKNNFIILKIMADNNNTVEKKQPEIDN